MFYKLTLDGAIIDTVESPLACCRWDDRANMVLRCTEREAPNAIISERIGQYIHVNGWKEFPPEAGYDGGDADLIEIDEVSYEALCAALDDGETPEDGSLHEPEEPAEDDSEPETTAQKLMRRIEEQSKIIEAQNEQITMLTECVLEMSEVVYG